MASWFLARFSDGGAEAKTTLRVSGLRGWIFQVLPEFMMLGLVPKPINIRKPSGPKQRTLKPKPLKSL